jgi:hypothetical protein
MKVYWFDTVGMSDLGTLEVDVPSTSPENQAIVIDRQVAQAVEQEPLRLLLVRPKNDVYIAKFKMGYRGNYVYYFWGNSPNLAGYAQAELNQFISGPEGYDPTSNGPEEIANQIPETP